MEHITSPLTLSRNPSPCHSLLPQYFFFLMVLSYNLSICVTYYPSSVRLGNKNCSIHHLVQWLAHGVCPINACWMDLKVNEWVNAYFCLSTSSLAESEHALKQPASELRCHVFSSSRTYSQVLLMFSLHPRSDLSFLSQFCSLYQIETPLNYRNSLLNIFL